MKPAYAPIGNIIQIHGLKGEVAIQLTESIESFEKIAYLFIKEGGAFVPYRIEQASKEHQHVVLKLEAINDRSTAHTLLGKTTWLPTDLLAALTMAEEPDSEPSIIGYEVVDTKEGMLGTVQRIEKFPMHTCLVTLYQEKELLIPYQAAIIASVNDNKQQITIELPSDFLEALGHKPPAR
jgi:16S rRNA processing protein RimM